MKRQILACLLAALLIVWAPPVALAEGLASLASELDASTEQSQPDDVQSQEEAVSLQGQEGVCADDDGESVACEDGQYPAEDTQESAAGEQDSAEGVLEVVADEPEPATVAQEPVADEQEPVADEQESPQLVSDGTYTIRSAAGDNFVLDIMGGSQDDGANLALYTLTGMNWQQFTLTYEGDGFYSIVALHSDKAISATGTDRGANVVQQPYTGDDSQLWEMEDAGGGWYRLKSKLSGLYLDVQGGHAGNSVNVWTWDATSNNSGLGQMFAFDTALQATVEDGTYALVCASDELQVVDVVASSKASGANVTCYFNGNDSNQKFAVERQANGYYTIKATHSGQVLDVVASGKANGTNVTQWPYTGADNQLWEIEDAGGGWYRLKSKCSGLYLDVQGGYAGNTVNIQTWEATDNNSGKGQLFRFARMIDDGYYKIASSDNVNYVLDVVAGSIKDGANVTLWQDSGTTNQIFQIYHMYGECYKIVNVRSWKALDVVAGGKANGTNVTQWSQYSTSNQAWKGEVSSDGSVRFRSEASGLYLDVQGGHAGNSVNIQTWEATDNNGGRGQSFVLTQTSPGYCWRVPEMLQYPEMPAGCEVYSLTSVLRALGYNPSTALIANSYIPYIQTGGWYATACSSSPYTTGECLPPCIVIAGNSYLSDVGSSFRFSDCTGTGFSELETIANKGYPVLVWTTIYLRNPGYSSNLASYTFYPLEHCVVMLGSYDGRVYVMDPLVGLTSYDRDWFAYIYARCGSMSVKLA